MAGSLALEKGHAGLLSCPVSAPAAQCSPLPAAHNPGPGSPVEEVPGTASSPRDLGEEAEKSAMGSTSAGLSPHIEGCQRRKGGREDQRAGLKPLSGASVVLGASVPLSMTGSLWAVGP